MVQMGAMTLISRRPLPRSALRHPPTRRIVGAARQHFFAHGFRGVTMDDLARELGMSKKTLYACFRSKSALIKAVLLEKFREIDVDLQRITSDCSNITQVLHDLLACVQRHTGEIQPPFVRDIRREAPELFAMVEDNRRAVIQRHFGTFFKHAQKAGIIRTGVPPALILEILLGSVHAVLNPAKLAELGLTPQTGFSAVITVIFEGVITDSARNRR
jgi:AcrR family transcriptional regulator